MKWNENVIILVIDIDFPFFFAINYNVKLTTLQWSARGYFTVLY